MNIGLRRCCYLLFILMYSTHIAADDFAQVGYDAQQDVLLVTMIYRGTHPNHHFSLRWGQCQTHDDQMQVAAEVLDDQWNDVAQSDFRKKVKFTLQDIPCRPAQVTLRTAPRFFVTVFVPAVPAQP